MVTTVEYPAEVESSDLAASGVGQPKWKLKTGGLLYDWFSSVPAPGRTEWHRIEIPNDTAAHLRWLQRLEAWIDSSPPAAIVADEALGRDRIY